MSDRPSGRSDPHPRRTALVIGAVVVGAGMAISIAAPHSIFGVEFWVPNAPHHSFWIVPTDFLWAVNASSYVANGALGYMYEAAFPYYGLPLFPILLAPLVAIGQAFQLSTGALPAGLVPHPTMWLLLGPFVLATVVPLIYGLRRFARAVGVERTMTMEILVVVLAFGPALWPGGHVEDVLALAFVLIALAEAIEGRELRGALIFSLAIATKQWAAIGLPLYLFVLPRRDRLRSLIGSVALPGVLAAFVLLVDFPHARYSLMQAPGYVVQGREAPFAIDLPRYPYVITSQFRLAMFCAAGLLAVLLRKQVRRETIAAAFGLTYLVRFLFEPTPPAYYLAPALAFFLVDERLRGRRHVWVPLIGLAILWAFALPGSVAWWLFVAGAAVVLAIPAALHLWNGRRNAAYARLAPATALVASAGCEH